MSTDFSVHASDSANHSLNLTYTRHEDYYLPDLEAPETPRISKFGSMRHDYLRTWHRGVFDAMLIKGTLNAHLEEIDRQANEMLERLTLQMATDDGQKKDQDVLIRKHAVDHVLEAVLLLGALGFHVFELGVVLVNFERHGEHEGKENHRADNTDASQ